MSELLPCPFCGGEAAWIDCKGGRAYVQCYSCEIEAPEHSTRAGAIASWNQRAPTWQPIETAPRDGTDILCWDGDSVSIMYWSLYAKKWAWADPYIEDVTHWMPLPEPPQ